MAINLNEHCNLCDNVKSNLQNGIIASDFDYIEYKRSAGNILLMFLGFGLIILGFNKLNRYRKKMKTVLDEKKKIDTVLNEYKI